MAMDAARPMPAAASRMGRACMARRNRPGSRTSSAQSAPNARVSIRNSVMRYRSEPPPTTVRRYPNRKHGVSTITAAQRRPTERRLKVNTSKGQNR